jgi:hypothetical protein
MSNRKELSYKWVIIGGFVIITLHTLMRLLLLGGVTASIITSYGQTTGSLIVAGIVAFVAYFIGGGIIGFFSPGETVKEPALATFMAILPNALHNFMWYVELDSSQYFLSGWALGTLITLGVGILMAVGGAFIGEKFQGQTVEKLREEGELPPARPSNDKS